MQQLTTKMLTVRKCMRRPQMPQQQQQQHQWVTRLVTSRFNSSSSNSTSSASTPQPSCTALYDFHRQQGGKMVNFGGSLLPVQYADQSIIASHLHTRQYGSIFDVSHMLQTWLRGRDAIRCLESICTADIAGSAPGSAMLSVFTSAETGGILDDLIVTKVDDRSLYVVSNAAMKQQDISLMSAAVSHYKAQGGDISVEFLHGEQQSLIAVQGPQAVATLKTLLPPGQEQQALLDQLYFMQSGVGELAGVPDCRITRCGYTGEDGVEISVSSSQVQHITEALLHADLHEAGGAKLRLAGLGARDSLRLEAGLCLYGSDIDAQTTPVEANLTWLLAKRRRQEANFPGAYKILSQLPPNSVQRRRIGLHMLGAQVPAARAGVEVYHNELLVGQVTSGCPSPTLGKNIAMGYILEQLKQPGGQVQLKIREKLYAAEVVPMPFTKTNYYLKPKNK